MPPCFEELVVLGFNCPLPELKTVYAMPNITSGIFLAIQDSPVAFVKALLCAVESLTRLERQEDTEDNDWGHTYSLDNVELLKSWLLKNDPA
jgi:TusA-related sulfurtransferase